MGGYFSKKPLSSLLTESTEVGEHQMKRTLGPWNLVMLGIGAIIGAGLFVRTAAAAANNAGPSVTLGFILASVGSAFAGLCYAELASMIPIAGSAYTYTYATMGELLAWIIGWDLVLGWGFINPANPVPYIPPDSSFTDAQGIAHHYGGLMGILGAGGVVFFAFIGFDAVSTAAQEARQPKRDMPIGILGSLAICTVLYILFAHVLTGIATVDDFRHAGKEPSVAYAITTYMPGFGWLAKLVTVAIL